MKIIGMVASPLLSLFGGLLKKPKMPVAQPTPIPNRDDAAANARTELARRRGGAADMVTGAFGAPAPAGGKTTLGS